MELLSTWYRDGFQWLTSHMRLVRSVRGKQKIYSATSHCRAAYIEALQSEVGHDRALAILQSEGLTRASKQSKEVNE